MVARPDEKVPRLPSVMSLWPSERGIGNHHADVLVGKAELFRGHQADGSARAADVDGAHGNGDGAIGCHVDVAAGLAAEVEPEAAGHAASLVLAQRRLHVRMVLGCLKRGANADGAVDRAIGDFGALLGGILDAEFNRHPCRSSWPVHQRRFQRRRPPWEPTARGRPPSSGG